VVPGYRLSSLGTYRGETRGSPKPKQGWAAPYERGKPSFSAAAGAIIRADRRFGRQIRKQFPTLTARQIIAYVNAALELGFEIGRPIERKRCARCGIGLPLEYTIELSKQIQQIVKNTVKRKKYHARKYSTLKSKDI